MSDQAITGKWVHRSYLNTTDLLGRMAINPVKLDDEPNKSRLPDFGAKAVKLMWAEGVASLEEGSAGQAEGTLTFGPGAVLQLTARTGSDGDRGPRKIEIEANGQEGSAIEKFKYSLVGWFVDPWQDGIEQKPTIVGTIINRGVPDPEEPVGTVGSFILTKTG